jgi:Cobalamin-independent synthase, Catalytic domain
LELACIRVARVVAVKDIAESKATRETEAARSNGYSLLLTTEPEEQRTTLLDAFTLRHLASRSEVRYWPTPTLSEIRRDPMLYSTDRILTTHAGSLPRPPDLRDMVLAKANGEPYDPTELDERLKSAVAEVVRRQIEIGIDCVNDGELSKTNFTDYVRHHAGPITTGFRIVWTTTTLWSLDVDLVGCLM